MTNEDRSTHEMVQNLHIRFDRLDERMDALHADHLLLRDHVDKLKYDVREDVKNLEKHEAEACLKENAILTQLSILTKRFDHHAEQEEKDRRWVLGIVIATMLSSIGTLLVMVLSG